MAFMDIYGWLSGGTLCRLVVYSLALALASIGHKVYHDD